MNLLKVIVFLLLSVSVADLGYSATLKQSQKDYSAKVLMTLNQDGSKMSVPGMVYYSSGNERREMEMMGRKTVTIRRGDIVWTLVPSQRMYLESRFDDEHDDKNPIDLLQDDRLVLTKLGQEKVNGVVTDKFSMKDTDPESEPMQGFLWLLDEAIPVRVDGTIMEEGVQSHFVIDMTDIRFAPQPDSLFEIPAGYQRMQVSGFENVFGAGKGTMQPDAPPANKMELDISPEQLKQFQEQMEKLQQQMEN
jgi:outer membrane lipoprotein-sorting protein